MCAGLHLARRTLDTSPATSRACGPGPNTLLATSPPAPTHPMPHAPTWAVASTVCISSTIPHQFSIHSHFGFTSSAARLHTEYPPLTERSTVNQHHHHAGGPEALLRVLCRYLMRVPDRLPLTTDRPRHDGNTSSCSTESEATRLAGMWEGQGRRRGSWAGMGMDIRGAALFTHLCAWIPTVGPLRGRGPRPLCPFLGPPPQCNTVGHPRPRLIFCLAPPPLCRLTAISRAAHRL